jgi:hypothetical protein
LLTPEADLLSDFSISRIHFSIFRKPNGILLTPEADLLSDFSISRNHPGDRNVAKARQDLPKFAQVNR